jgi:hypothetical protein
MIPNVINDASILFIANGRPWTLAADHPKFNDVKALLVSGTDDADQLIKLTDVRVAVEAATGGQAVLTDDALYLNGEVLSPQWREKAAEQPDAMRVLLVNPGDVVRVEGDEDAPDGIYTVGEVDNKDVNRRVYVESEEDYFGFVANASIKEIIEKAENPPPQVWSEPEPEDGCGCSLEHEQCDNCGDDLDCGQTGLCDACELTGEDDE